MGSTWAGIREGIPERWDALETEEIALLRAAYRYRREEFGNLSLDEALWNDIRCLTAHGDAPTRDEAIKRYAAEAAK